MRRRILLADDSVTIQKVIELTFMDDDYEVKAVGNGDEALALLAATRFDFVIADVHMPGANGYEVCRRSKELRPGLPVLLLVGTFEPFDEAQARAAGADSFLKKPFDSQELLQRVHELLAQAPAPTVATPSMAIPIVVPSAPPAAPAQAPPSPAPSVSIPVVPAPPWQPAATPSPGIAQAPLNAPPPSFAPPDLRAPSSPPSPPSSATSRPVPVPPPPAFAPAAPFSPGVAPPLPQPSPSYSAQPPLPAAPEPVASLSWQEFELEAEPERVPPPATGVVSPFSPPGAGPASTSGSQRIQPPQRARVVPEPEPMFSLEPELEAGFDAHLPPPLKVVEAEHDLLQPFSLGEPLAAAAAPPDVPAGDRPFALGEPLDDEPFLLEGERVPAPGAAHQPAAAEAERRPVRAAAEEERRPFSLGEPEPFVLDRQPASGAGQALSGGSRTEPLVFPAPQPPHPAAPSPVTPPALLAPLAPRVTAGGPEGPPPPAAPPVPALPEDLPVHAREPEADDSPGAPYRPFRAEAGPEAHNLEDQAVAAPVAAAAHGPTRYPEVGPDAGTAAAPANGGGALAPSALDKTLDDAAIDRIARRVVELMGDRVVRDVAWEVIPDLAEIVIKDRLRELESQIE